MQPKIITKLLGINRFKKSQIEMFNSFCMTNEQLAKMQAQEWFVAVQQLEVRQYCLNENCRHKPIKIFGDSQLVLKALEI